MIRKIINFIASIICIGCNSQTTDSVDQSTIYETTAGQSKERVEKVLPEKASEDKSSILTLKEINFPERRSDHFANETIEWIITLKNKNGKKIDNNVVKEIFSNEWREKFFSPSFYYKKPDGDWTWLTRRDTVQNYNEFVISWKLFTGSLDTPTTFTREMLQNLKNEIVRISEKQNFSLEFNFTIDEASKKAKAFGKLVKECEQYSTIVLKADDKFSGKEIWDVMLCLNLKWGDMDIFHWNNMIGDGDDSFFSVWTSSSPGYFFPEEIAKGKVTTDDLVFGFSIPRSYDPEQILEKMYEAVQYAQTRLGGQILNDQYKPISIDFEREKVQSIIEALDKENIQCGSTEAMRLL